MTEQELAGLVKKAPVRSKSATGAKPTGVQRWQALGRMPKDKMNATEKAYSELLEGQRIAGEVISWKFHPMNIRLADKTFYEVDFLVLHADMTLAIHEVKGGFTSEKGQLKIKMVSEVMPYFAMIKAIKQTKAQGGSFRLEYY